MSLSGIHRVRPTMSGPPPPCYSPEDRARARIEIREDVYLEGTAAAAYSDLVTAAKIGVLCALDEAIEGARAWAQWCRHAWRWIVERVRPEFRVARMEAEANEAIRRVDPDFAAQLGIEDHAPEPEPESYSAARLKAGAVMPLEPATSFVIRGPGGIKGLEWLDSQLAEVQRRGGSVHVVRDDRRLHNG